MAQFRPRKCHFYDFRLVLKKIKMLTQSFFIIFMTFMTKKITQRQAGILKKLILISRSSGIFYDFMSVLKNNIMSVWRFFHISLWIYIEYLSFLLTFGW
jgi:hypothetical protein